LLRNREVVKKMKQRQKDGCEELLRLIFRGTTARENDEAN